MFGGARLRWGGRREDGAAEAAAQPLQLVNGGLEERLRHDANQAGRSLEQVKLGAQTFGAELTDLECGMGYLDPLGSRVILGPIATMTFALGFGLAGGLLGSRVGCRLGRKHLGGRLG